MINKENANVFGVYKGECKKGEAAKANKILMSQCKMCADSNKNMILGSDFDQHKAFERD